MLEAVDLPYAELWRALRPVSARLGIPRPGYWMVRKILIEERRRKLERLERLGDFAEDLAKGVFPRL